MSRSRLSLPRVVVRDTALNYGSSLFVGTTQLLILVVLTHRLAKADVGTVVLSTAISGTIATAAELGVGPLIATNYQRLPHQNPRLWAALVRFLARLITLLAVSTLVLGLVAGVVLVRLGHEHAGAAIGFGVVTGAITVASGYVQTFLVAQKLFLRLALASSATAVIRIGAVFVLAGIGGLTTTAVLVVYLVSVIITIVAMAPALPRPIFPSRASHAVSVEARRLALSVMRWVMVSRGAAVITGRLDVVLLSTLTTRSTVATYAAGYQPSTPLLMFGAAAGGVALPHLAGDLSRDRARRVIRRWIAWLPVFLSGALVYAAAGYALLPTVFGQDYAEARPVFAVLVFASAMLAWTQPVASLLYALARPRDVAILAVVYMIILIVLEVSLILALGMVGAALAILAAAVVGAAVGTRLSWRASARA